jgi:tetratricopeptide (TPR) repeat protein
MLKFSDNNADLSKVSQNRFALLILCLIVFSSVMPLMAGEDTDRLKQSLATSKGLDRVKVLNDLAWSLLEEMPDQAFVYATEALKLSRELKSLQEEARALYILADASYYLNNLKEAIGFYLASAEIELQIGGRESKLYLDRIGDAGYTYYISDQQLEALKYLQECLELSIITGYDSQAASMYSNIGSIYAEWGDYARAIENNQKALIIDRRIGESPQIAVDLNNIGKIYEMWGKYEEAVRYYQESLKLAQTIGNQAMIAIRLNNLGSVNKAWNQYAQALDFYQQALEIERKMGSMEKVGRRLTNIAATYLSMKLYDKCLSCLNQASPIVKKANLTDDLARFYNVYGNYFLAIHDYPSAIASFGHSQEYAEKNNLKPLQMGNLQSLADAYEKSGNPAFALESMKKFLILKDSVFTAESNTKLAEFQARFENEKVRMENEVLKKDATLKWNVYLLSGTISFALMVVLLSIILILRLKTRNARQSREMAEQQAGRLELELELRNKELTCNAMSIISKNETVTEMIEALEKAIREGQPAEVVNSVFEKIRNGDRDSNWKEFEVRFTQVHKDFYDKLNERYPDLSPNERKLCAFLRLNMTTKDIASITHQSVHSINVARTRLRKKMNLANSEENLVNFLINL